MLIPCQYLRRTHSTKSLNVVKINKAILTVQQDDMEVRGSSNTRDHSLEPKPSAHAHHTYNTVRRGLGTKTSKYLFSVLCTNYFQPTN